MSLHLHAVEPVGLMDWIERVIVARLAGKARICKHGVIEQDGDRCPACVCFGSQPRREPGT